MFNANFWPTPPEVATRMIELLDEPAGISILEPSAGAGNLVIMLKAAGYNVIACEEDQRLKRVLEHECPVIVDNFFTLTSEQISHIKAIVMNPPFYSAERHIRHAWEIAPEGCKIISLCNSNTLENSYSRGREQLGSMVKDYGYSLSLGQAFKTAERSTEVEVSLVYLQKPSSNYDTEFEGFFLDEEPEEQGEEGLMPYDAVRDIVNRYVAAVKLYDEQIQVGVKMRGLINIFPSYHDKQGKEEHMKYISCNPEKVAEYQADFKKGLQKRAWKLIFDKLDLAKHSTRGLKEDLNKFVEHQVHIPFTMKNIYKMLEIVIGTTGSRMDKAMLEVFDKLTQHYDENRYHVEGWKTNSHYLVNQKFIINHICGSAYSTGKIGFDFYRSGELLEDLLKALCYMTGKRYEDAITLTDRVRGYEFNTVTGKIVKTERWEPKIEDPNVITVPAPEFGELFDWEFFQVRGYKKGTMHFKFKDENVWFKFNQHIARIKGYPLFEGNSKRAGYQSSFFTDKQDAA